MIARLAFSRLAQSPRSTRARSRRFMSMPSSTVCWLDRGSKQAAAQANCKAKRREEEGKGRSNPSGGDRSGQTFLGFAKRQEEQVVVGDRFLDELNEQKHFGGIDDRVDPLLEGLQGIKRGQGKTEQNEYGMAALVHRHSLHGQQALVFGGRGGGERFLQDDDVIRNLAEFVKKLAMIDGRMDFVAELIQGGLGRVHQLGGAQAEQRRLVGGREKIKFDGHGVTSILPWTERIACGFVRFRGWASSASRRSARCFRRG